MKKAIGMALFVSAFSLVMSGCGAEGSSTSANNNDSSRNIDTSNQLTVTELARGNQPVSGAYGSHRIVQISDAEEFEKQWFNYSNATLPDVDFNTNAVVLWDRGSININNCGSLASLSKITAVKLDDRISMTNINLTKRCPNPEVSCAAVIAEGSPFVIMSIPKYTEMFVSEVVTIEACD